MACVLLHLSRCKVKNTMKRNKIAWYLWAVGTVLIALSWFGVVSNAVGWCGFVIGMAGSVLSWGVRPPQNAARPETPKPKV
jgi:hypothetical protein